MPADCYLCWALGTESLRLRAVMCWSPGKTFILVAALRPHSWAAEDPLYVSPRGGGRVTGGNDKKGRAGSVITACQKITDSSVAIKTSYHHNQFFFIFYHRFIIVSKCFHTFTFKTNILNSVKAIIRHLRQIAAWEKRCWGWVEVCGDWKRTSSWGTSKVINCMTTAQ